MSEGNSKRKIDDRVRNEFPTLKRIINDKPLVYLDSAASALKPQAVIDRMTTFYQDEYSNIHRGAHSLSAEATSFYENARSEIAHFIGADSDEVIFTRSCTESINLLADLIEHSNTDLCIEEGDEIIISEVEHHSNILAWQRLCERKKAKLQVIDIDDDGNFDFEDFSRKLTKKTKLIALTEVSNVLGSVLPIENVIKAARSFNVKVFVDGAQGIVHQPVDVKALDCDFYAFSGHKLYGPTGIGVLWGKKDLLNQLSPYQVGGGIIDKVTFEKSTFLKSPLRYEAGTPHIAGALGLAAAVKWLNQIGMDAIAAHEEKLFRKASEELLSIKGVKIIGNARKQVSVRSFIIEDIHPSDIGTLLDQQGIAVRIGHHCAQPLMKRFNIPATTRASFGIYNNEKDVDRLIAGVKKVIDLFG